MRRCGKRPPGQPKCASKPARVMRLAAVVAATSVAAGFGLFTRPGGDIPPARAADGARVVSIDVGGVPTSLVETSGAVWVATGLGGIVRIDPFTNEPIGRIQPGGSVSMLARGYAALWAIDVFRGRLLRIDPRAGRVTRAIDVDALPSGLAIGHGLVWVESQLASSVAGIDPRTGQVRKLALFARGELWPGGLAVSRDGVWVVTAGGNEVSLFDPVTMTFRRRLHVSGARTLSVDGSGAWVGLAGRSFVLRIQHAHPAKVPTFIPAGGYGPVLTGHGPLWVGSTGAVSQIARSGTVVRRIRLPRGQPVDALAVSGGLWVADQRHRKVLRIAVAHSPRGLRGQSQPQTENR